MKIQINFYLTVRLFITNVKSLILFTAHKYTLEIIILFHYNM